MDRRQKKTRKAIMDAFYSLLTMKKYANITVQDIIDAADVGRSTFYAHFETKEALLDEICSGLFEHVSMPSGAECTHDFTNEPENITHLTAHILCHLTEPDNPVLTMIRGESRDIFLTMFKDYLKNAFSEYGNYRNYTEDVPEDLILSHISGSFVNLIEWWTASGMKEDSDTLMRYYLDMMRSSLIL